MNNDRIIKPDISAPGIARSAYVNHQYAEMEGTSMAAPHIAGNSIFIEIGAIGN